MEPLSDDAKKLIAEHCKTVLEQYGDALREVQIYKWAARAFFALVLGGSIIGFLQLQGYLDDRITKNTSNLEHLFYAKSLSDGGQPREALPELLEFARISSATALPDSVPSEGSGNLFGDFAKAGPSIRQYFFLSLLDVISSIPTDAAEDASFGKVEWDQLLRNTRFRTDILNNPRWEDDERILNSLGHAFAKFAGDRTALLQVRPYFEKQRQYAQSRDYKATASFVLGVYSLGDGDIKAAAKSFREANAAKPKWIDDAEDYFATPDPLYWMKLFPSRAEFVKRYQAALDAKEAAKPPKG
ncbi:MAG: hypothetical protein ACHQK9_03400 [Reyranellales bacterium]